MNIDHELEKIKQGFFEAQKALKISLIVAKKLNLECLMAELPLIIDDLNESCDKIDKFIEAKPPKEKS